MPNSHQASIASLLWCPARCSLFRFFLFRYLLLYLPWYPLRFHPRLRRLQSFPRTPHPLPDRHKRRYSDPLHSRLPDQSGNPSTVHSVAFLPWFHPLLPWYLRYFLHPPLAAVRPPVWRDRIRSVRFAGVSPETLGRLSPPFNAYRSPWRMASGRFMAVFAKQG